MSLVLGSSRLVVAGVGDVLEVIDDVEISTTLVLGLGLGSS